MRAAMPAVYGAGARRVPGSRTVLTAVSRSAAVSAAAPSPHTSATLANTPWSWLNSTMLPSGSRQRAHVPDRVAAAAAAPTPGSPRRGRGLGDVVDLVAGGHLDAQVGERRQRRAAGRWRRSLSKLTSTTMNGLSDHVGLAHPGAVAVGVVARWSSSRSGVNRSYQAIVASMSVARQRDVGEPGDGGSLHERSPYPQSAAVHDDLATPSSAFEPVTSSARRRTAGWAFSTATRRPPSGNIGRSLISSPNTSTSSRVDAQVLAQPAQADALVGPGGCDLDGVGAHVVDGERSGPSTAGRCTRGRARVRSGWNAMQLDGVDRVVVTDQRVGAPVSPPDAPACARRTRARRRSRGRWRARSRTPGRRRAACARRRGPSRRRTTPSAAPRRRAASRRWCRWPSRRSARPLPAACHLARRRRTAGDRWRTPPRCRQRPPPAARRPCVA